MGGMGDMRIMSVTLRLDADDGTPCPYRFIHSDTRRLAEFCTGADEAIVDAGEPVIARLERQLGLDLRPLTLVAEEDMELEQFTVVAASANDAERLWREHLLRAEAAWQPPEELAVCVRSLVRALTTHPRLFDSLRLRLGLPGGAADYYVDGGLCDDLADLLLMADWADACGVRRVRLVAL